MRHDHRQHSVLIELAQFITTKVAELFLVDHLEPAIDERLFAAVGLDRDFAFHQETRFDQLGHERIGALAGLFELLAELENAVDLGRRRVAVEQSETALVLAHRARSRVVAQRQLVAFLVQPREQERIAADISGDIDGRVADHPGLVEKGVGAFVEPHQRQRHRVVARREDDRIVALGKRELVDGQRNRVSRRQLRQLVERMITQFAMRLALDRLEARIEQGQVGRRFARHVG